MPSNAFFDPNRPLGFEFADFGSIYTADGREHPLGGQTPVAVDDSVRQSPMTPTTTTPAATVVSVSDWPKWLKDLLTPDFLEGQHVLARLVIVLLAIGMIFIAVMRLTRA